MALHRLAAELVVTDPLHSYETYQKMASLTDMDVAYDRVQASLLGMSGMMTARRVRRTRQRMGFHRHNLLVALRVVNSIEREMMQAEWETWRMNENANCQHLRIMVGQNKSRPFRHHERDRQGQSEDRHHYDEETLARYEAYCDSCSDERNRQL